MTQLAYGKKLLEFSPDPQKFSLTEIIPHNIDAMSEQKAKFIAAVNQPIAATPLNQLVAEKGIDNPSVVIVIADHTRPVPDHLLVPWTVEALGGDDAQVTVIIGTGTHRGSTAEEIDRGFEILSEAIFLADQECA